MKSDQEARFREVWPWKMVSGGGAQAEFQALSLSGGKTIPQS